MENFSEKKIFLHQAANFMKNDEQSTMEKAKKVKMHCIGVRTDEKGTRMNMEANITMSKNLRKP